MKDVKTEATAKDDARPNPVLALVEKKGDLFAAPKNTLLIHACNCVGSWGAGIAKAFATHYPRAYQQYKTHCLTHKKSTYGKSLLISPLDHDLVNGTNRAQERHFIGCLFTSRNHGRRKDSPKQILAATKTAMQDLLERVKVFNASAGEGERIEEVWMCRINAGLFRVPWAETRKVLLGLQTDDTGVRTVCVVSPSEDEV